MSSHMIKFGEIELAAHPFIWDYDEDILYPILKSQKLKSFDDIDFDNPKLHKILDLIRSYDIEYYYVKQTMFKETKISYVSFHSWYFSQISDKTNMTRSNFNVTVLTGLFTEKDNDLISENNKIMRSGIKINGTNKNDIHVHNTKLSPCYDNSFVINISDIKDNSKITFITVLICNKLRKCCLTKHVLIPV